MTVFRLEPLTRIDWNAIDLEILQTEAEAFKTQISDDDSDVTMHEFVVCAQALSHVRDDTERYVLCVFAHEAALRHMRVTENMDKARQDALHMFDGTLDNIYKEQLCAHAGVRALFEFYQVKGE